MSSTPTMTELKKMPPDELRRELRTKRAEYAKTRMEIDLGSEKNHASSRTIRRDIARMTMVLESLPPSATKAPVTASAPKASKKPSQAPKKAVKRSGPPSSADGGLRRAGSKKSS